MREPCYKCKFEHKPIDIEPCEHCSDVYIKTGDHPAFQHAKPTTNYDCIISKTPEELARWIWAVQSEIKHEDLFSTDGWYVWLMQEAAE